MSRRSLRSGRFQFVVASIAIAAASAFMACGNNNPPISDNGSVGTVGSTDTCATPGHEGCPCSPSGTTVACGKVTQQTGDYVTCEIGTATCNGSVWSACAGNHIVSQSLSGSSLTTQGLNLQTVTGGCSDPCDPFCTQSAQDPTDVDASGLVPTDGGIELTPTLGVPDASVPVCTGLQCNVTACTAGGSTTLTGMVYDPAGIRPLYNVYVYIPVDPTDALPAFSAGASCDTCAGSGSLNAVSVAQTDATGSFTLTGVPDGVPIPLVVQVGKWRREVILPAVAACTSTAVSAANTRLPRNRTDGNANHADMPHIAIATGSADPFECLLAKIGIDPAEIDVPSNGPAIDYYVSNGRDRYPGGAPGLSTLMASTATLNAYDAVILPCEGGEDDGNNAYVPSVAAYTDGGGKMFTTHFGYAWLATPHNGTAQNLSEYYGTATWHLETGSYDTWDPMTAYVDTSFPKGVAYSQWLENVGASSVLGQLTVGQPRHDAIAAINGSQQWMYGWSSTNDPGRVGSASTHAEDMMMHMTFNTPVGATTQCGRVVFSDFHVSTSDQISGNSCTSNTDCGYGATCNAAVAGVCTPQACTPSTTCKDNTLTCMNPTPGTCGPRTCTNNSNCKNGNACSGGVCQCSANSDCGSGNTCTGGVCSGGATCYTSTADCGGARRCSGVVDGQCGKTCSTGADCSSTEACTGGMCEPTCYTNGDCGGSSTCVGASPMGCSVSSNDFPYECAQTPMTAQEEALEFMFFDLAACVSNDSLPPPPPPQPVTYYYPASFTETFTASCPAGQTYKWREVDWQASIPNSASIVFSAQTGDNFTTLNPTTPLTIATATTSTALPNFDVGYIDLSDKGGGGAFDQNVPPVPSQGDLVLTIAMNPTSDQLATPTLGAWKVRYDCVDSQ